MRETFPDATCWSSTQREGAETPPRTGVVSETHHPYSRERTEMSGAVGATGGTVGAHRNP